MIEFCKVRDTGKGPFTLRADTRRYAHVRCHRTHWKLEQRCFPNLNRTQAAEIDLDLQTRPSEGPTRLPCEFGANPFSDSQIFHTQTKKVTDSAKNRTLRSSLRAVTMTCSH